MPRMQEGMDLNAAADMAYDLLYQTDLAIEGWGFRFDRAKRRLGQCDYTRRVISLSRTITLASNEDEVRQTLLHEVAHALVGHRAGHGPEWKRMARKLGYTGERCGTNPATDRAADAYAVKAGLEHAPASRDEYLRPGDAGVMVTPGHQGVRVRVVRVNSTRYTVELPDGRKGYVPFPYLRRQLEDVTA